MSTVAELLQKGNLSGAMERALQDVAERPDDHSARFVLFELLVLQEDFDGADAQLARLKDSSPDISQSAELYAGLIAAERARHRFRHTGEGAPSFLAKPPAWAAAFGRAAVLLGKGDLAGGAAHLKEAWDHAPVVAGWVDSVPFRSVRDADDVLGPFLEVLVPGRCCWIPFAQIESVRFAPPRGFQEVIWRPAEVEIREGPKGRFWVPSVYSGTGAREDIERLGRVTAFEYPIAGVCRGFGQRDLKLDDSLLMGILSVSSLVINHGTGAGPADVN